MFFVYVLRSKTTNRFYTGLTSDLPRRLGQHNTEYSVSTKHRGPWEFVHQEPFQTYAEAVQREKELKTGKGRDEVKRILNVVK